MISFKLTEEQEVVRDVLHEFAESAMRPIAREADEDSKIPEEFLAQAWQLGFVNTQLPEEFGGGGEERSPITNALVLEELAWGDATLAVAVAAPAGFAFAIADQGSDDQKQRYLPAFCGKDFHAAAIALCEPSPAFDPRSPRVVAEPKGDKWVLSGAKSFVPLGDRAEHFLVIARGEGNGLEAFIVPRNAAGLTTPPPDTPRGGRARAPPPLAPARVEVPAADRLGGDAGCDVQRLINHSRVALGAVMVGVSRAALEYAVPYAKDREAFDQAIAQKQGIAFKLADMHIETEATRWLVWKAASELEQGLDATRSSHFARQYASEKSLWIADEGVQVLGGHGYIREHPVEMWYRNARTLGVLEGTLSA